MSRLSPTWLDALLCSVIIQIITFMKQKAFIDFSYCIRFLFAIFIYSGSLFYTIGKDAAPNPGPTPEQRAARLKQEWIKVLNNARQSFQDSNDHESYDFAGSILDAIEQPDGLSAAAQEDYRVRICRRVRGLVREGALESAATFQEMLYHVFPLRGNDATGPNNPTLKTGGQPGPGGLVLYLPFDKPDDNGVVHDESGAGNDGRVIGAKWVPDGKFGGAYLFHITNLTDRIVIPNSDTLNPDHITLSAWIKAADRDGFWNRIMDKDYRNAYSLDLGGDYNGNGARGKLQFETSRGSIGSNFALNDGQWHHVAGTYDGKTISFYIDGVGRGRFARTPGPIKKSGWDLCIGNSMVDYGTGEFLAYDGLIDEVRIYNRALSGSEIKMLATATGPGVDVVPTPSPDDGAKPDAAERLRKVKALYDQGLINKEDYDKKVQEIMNSI
jgi:hypothetical protein